MTLVSELIKHSY